MTVREREPAARRIEALVAEDRDLLKASGKEALKKAPQAGTTGRAGVEPEGTDRRGGRVAAPGIAPAG
jgi:hypothetical protein